MKETGLCPSLSEKYGPLEQAKTAAETLLTALRAGFAQSRKSRFARLSVIIVDSDGIGTALEHPLEQLKPLIYKTCSNGSIGSNDFYKNIHRLLFFAESRKIKIANRLYRNTGTSEHWNSLAKEAV